MLCRSIVWSGAVQVCMDSGCTTSCNSPLSVFRQRLCSFGGTNTWFLVPGTGGLFATKWTHINHYGQIIGGPNFWWDAASCLISKSAILLPRCGPNFFWKKVAGRPKSRQRDTGEQNWFEKNPNMPKPGRNKNTKSRNVKLPQTN